jgi:hypothetical protein
VPAPIVVEVSAPEPRPSELAALIGACTRAATPNECITSDVKSSDPPLGVAIVRREGDRARVELGLRGTTRSEWSTRDLVFQPGDDELERYRAIGFAIGTLVAKQVEPPPPPPASSTEAPAPPVTAPPRSPAPRQAEPPPPPPPAVPPPRATWLELGGNVGLGLIPGPPRVGAAFRAASELAPGGLFAVLETSYAERVGEPSLRVRWLGMALGVGHPLTSGLRTLGVDVRLTFALERLSLTAREGERSAGDTRWKPGVAAGIDAHWDVRPPFSLLVGASTFVDPSHTVVLVGGEQVGESPALGLSGFLGLRFLLR